MKKEFSIADCPLGKQVPYPRRYDPSLLFPIPRQWSREKTFAKELAYGANLGEFSGVDIWNNYEFSFLDRNSGKRAICFLQIAIPSTSEFLIESKSFKLYLFSFAQQVLSDKEVCQRIEADCSAVTKSSVHVRLLPLEAEQFKAHETPRHYIKLDNRTSCETYDLDSGLLQADQHGKPGKQSYSFSNFRSLCLVSGKPDWAEIRIDINGPAVDADSLYRYLVSYRNHQGIHEQCVERIFFDLHTLLAPSELTVVGLFTRRGSLDINPVRSLQAGAPAHMATCWQRTIRQ